MARRKPEPTISPQLRIAAIAVAALAVLFLLFRGCGGNPEEEAAPVNTVPEDVRNLPDATPQPGMPGYGGVSGGQ
jgi:hypothetical protein